MQHRIIREITDFIFVENEPEKADIIFLPGGAHSEVPEKGAEIYKEGYAPLVLPSGKYAINTGAFSGVLTKRDIYNGAYATECEFYKDVLMKNGVEEKNIVCEDRATFTKMNAVNSRRITDGLGMDIKRAIICCKSFHARRCLMYYSFAYPDTELYICPTDVDGISRETWHLYPDATKTVMGELSKAGGQLTLEMNEFLGFC
ncbi:MAG: YdcF family protein [Clostridia bacterium]|nr:YdcF family protein [Clostridia bacterium]